MNGPYTVGSPLQGSKGLRECFPLYDNVGKAARLQRFRHHVIAEFTETTLGLKKLVYRLI